MSSEREFYLKWFGVKFKYLSQLVKNLLKEQDRKVSIKLLHLFLCKTCTCQSRMGRDQGWGQVQYLYLVLVLKYIFIST